MLKTLGVVSSYPAKQSNPAERTYRSLFELRFEQPFGFPIASAAFYYEYFDRERGALNPVISCPVRSLSRG